MYLIESIENKFIDSLVTLSNSTNRNFSGVGFVLYHDLNILSEYHCNLVDGYQALPILCVGTDAFNQFIFKISDINHPCHDGFHFINRDGILTHIAQFFSPPANKYLTNVKGQGSRTFCSQVGSLLQGVTLVGSISTNKTIYLFKNGNLISLDKMNQVRYLTCF